MADCISGIVLAMRISFKFETAMRFTMKTKLQHIAMWLFKSIDETLSKSSSNRSACGPPSVTDNLGRFPTAIRQSLVIGLRIWYLKRYL